MWWGHNLTYAVAAEMHIRKTIAFVGEQQASEIKNKIYASSNVNSLLRQAAGLGRMPNQKEIVKCVQSMFYFLFKTHRAVLLASLYVLERWEKEINLKYRTVSDDDLVDTLERVVALCENISNGSTDY